MTGLEWAVLAGGIAVIVWINWYFLGTSRAVGDARSATGTQEVRILVKGGYEPAAFRVSRERPVRLVFDRQETSACSEEVVFPDFSLRRFLPAHEQTAIELKPERAGTYEFTCGMGMLHGRMIVE